MIESYLKPSKKQVYSVLIKSGCSTQLDKAKKEKIR